MHWYLTVLKKYAVFQGRARRKEYWMFCLVNVVVLLALAVFDVRNGGTGIGMATVIYVVATFLPSLGVNVRRLHDTSRSGWWILLSFIPVIGPLVLLIFTVQDSAPGENRFGPNPKMATA